MAGGLFEEASVCLTLPWRVTEVLDGERVRVCCDADVLEVSRVMEPQVDVGDHVLVSCGYVVRRLAPDEVAEIAAILGTSARP
jgi:hydrogenase expression/formation protein HypC